MPCRETNSLSPVLRRYIRDVPAPFSHMAWISEGKLKGHRFCGDPEKVGRMPSRHPTFIQQTVRLSALWPGEYGAMPVSIRIRTANLDQRKTDWPFEADDGVLGLAIALFLKINISVGIRRHNTYHKCR